MARVYGVSFTRKEKKPLVNESMNLRRAVAAMEQNRGRMQCLGDICQRFNVKRRVLYDFTSIMERYGVCSRVNNERFLWNGLHTSESAIEQIEEYCMNVHDEKSMRNLLDCSRDSSLPHIGEAIITLFLHLKVSTLNIKEICTYLAGPSKYHTMLRKLYTVASRLEVGGILKRTENSAEIKLVRNPNGKTINRSLKLSDMINTESELKMENVFEQRRRVFYSCQCLGDKSAVSTGYSHSSSGSSTQPSSPESAVSESSAL